MILSAKKINLPPLQEGGKNTTVSMNVEAFADDRAIGVFSLHPQNEGASSVSQVGRDIVDGLTQELDIAPRDFRYFEDLGERNDLDPQKYARYRERNRAQGFPVLRGPRRAK